MRIICIGRNYSDHARELKNPIPAIPVVFLKPDTSLLKNGKPFYYPDFSNNIHYEAEIVLKISKNGKHINKKFAYTYYEEISIGIDLTARDIQEQCKVNGHPWERAKAFDHSAVIGTFMSKREFSDLQNLNFSLNLNGLNVQDGNTKDMLFPIDQIISEISQFISLKQGDLVFTGTPAGVGPITIGDKFKGFIEKHLLLSCNIK